MAKFVDKIIIAGNVSTPFLEAKNYSRMNWSRIPKDYQLKIFHRVCCPPFFCIFCVHCSSRQPRLLRCVSRRKIHWKRQKKPYLKCRMLFYWGSLSNSSKRCTLFSIFSLSLSVRKIRNFRIIRMYWSETIYWLCILKDTSSYHIIIASHFNMKRSGSFLFLVWLVGDNCMRS